MAAWVVGGVWVIAACGDRDPGPRRQSDQAPVVYVDPGAGAIADRVVTPEREPNAATDPATPAGPGQRLRGSLDGETDVDTFAITVPAAGSLRVLEVEAAEVDLVLELRDANGRVFRADRGGAKLTEGLAEVPVTAGPVTLVVREFVPAQKAGGKAKPRIARVGLSKPYGLDVTFTATAAHDPASEREPNETAPGELALSEPVRGTIGWNGDLDAWTVSLLALGTDAAIDVELPAVPGLAPTVTIKDGAGQVLTTRTASKDAGVLIRGVTPPEGVAPSLTVEVSSKRAMAFAPYTLVVQSRVRSDDEEREPNDAITTAHPLDLNLLGLRGTVPAGDVDVFRVEADPAARRLIVNVAPVTGVAWTLDSRLDPGGLVTTHTGASGAEARLELMVPAGAVGYLTLKGKLGRSAPAAPGYELAWSIELAPPDRDGLPVGADDPAGQDLDRDEGDDPLPREEP